MEEDLGNKVPEDDSAGNLNEASGGVFVGDDKIKRLSNNKLFLALFILIIFVVVVTGVYFIVNRNNSPLTKDLYAEKQVAPIASPSGVGENTKYIEVRKEIQNSSTYSFAWDSETKKVKILENGNQIYDFVLSEKPIAAWVYKPKKIFAVVTAPGGETDSRAPHKLYIVKNDIASLVIAGKKESDFSSEVFYDFWDYNTSYPKDSFDHAMEFSPDGKYLLVTTLVYEGATHATINMDDLSVNNQDGFGPGKVFWSSSSECVLNYIEFYENSIALARSSAKSFQTKNMKMDEWLVTDPNLKEVLWGDGCSGVVYFEFQNSKKYYNFDYFSGAMVANDNPSLSSLSKSADVDQENVFVTVTYNEVVK